MTKAELTQARLRELLDYNPETGIFTWRIAVGRGPGRRYVGAVAGCCSRTTRGYVWIQVPGDKLYRAHRLAFLWVTGAWPKQEVDHINGVRDDNRWANLREATRSQNSQNIGGVTQTKKSSRFVGVFKNGTSGPPWISFIKRDGKQRNLGYFHTEEAAYAAYLKAKDELHPTHRRLRKQGATQ